MTTWLLDVNVLIALVDPAHLHHDEAHAWFAREGSGSWATCPLTETALLRILGNPRYANSAGSPAAVMPLLSSLRALPGHVFWPDDISVCDKGAIDPMALLSHQQVTDSYLLALARKRKGRLATFDRRLVTSAVKGGAATLHVIREPARSST